MAGKLELDKDGRFNFGKVYVTRLEVYNGYRCCCYQSWDFQEAEESTLEEAVRKYLKPDEIPDIQELTDTQMEKCEIFEVDTWGRVTDEGDVIQEKGIPELMAWGYLTWPIIFGGRGNGYKGSKWSKYDGNKDFCVMSGVPEGMSWDEFCQDLQLKQDARNKEKKR